MPVDALPIAECFDRDDARAIIARSHWVRTLGLALGGLMVASVLHQRQAPVAVWVLLAVHALAWPHVAWLILRRSRDPVTRDKQFFLGDVAMGGAWIALMQFSLLPSVLLATMYAITLIAIDGSRLLWRGLGLLVLACAVAGTVGGFMFAPATSMPELLASLPLLVVFPVTLGILTRRLSGQVHEQNRRLLALSSIDALSGLLNRTHWEAAANIALARRRAHDAVMLLLDIDRFKATNDRFGHTAGDAVIRRVGAIILGSLRDGDLAGRYGGDEFAVVLFGVGIPEAAVVAERIRSKVALAEFERSPGLRCTLSIGLARAPEGVRDASEWVKAADAALYRAKLQGRDRYAVA